MLRKRYVDLANDEGFLLKVRLSPCLLGLWLAHFCCKRQIASKHDLADSSYYNTISHVVQHIITKHIVHGISVLSTASTVWIACIVPKYVVYAEYLEDTAYIASEVNKDIFIHMMLYKVVLCWT